MRSRQSRWEVMVIKNGVKLWHLDSDYFERWIHARIRRDPELVFWVFVAMSWVVVGAALAIVYQLVTIGIHAGDAILRFALG